MRAARTWTGLAGSGRMALIDHRDVAQAGLRVLTDPALWGAHHEVDPGRRERLHDRADTFQQITVRPPRPVAGFLHENRAQFV